MIKADLISEVAKVVSIKKEAQKAVECTFSIIKNTLINRESVQIAGFGRFKVAIRLARKGRNPQTGEEIDIKAKMVPKFVPGKVLKDAVR